MNKRYVKRASRKALTGSSRGRGVYRLWVLSPNSRSCRRRASPCRRRLQRRGPNPNPLPPLGPNSYAHGPSPPHTHGNNGPAHGNAPGHGNGGPHAAARIQVRPVRPRPGLRRLRTQREDQAFFEAAGGPALARHYLDGDEDGIACELLP